MSTFGFHWLPCREVPMLRHRTTGTMGRGSNCHVWLTTRHSHAGSYIHRVPTVGFRYDAVQNNTVLWGKTESLNLNVSDANVLNTSTKFCRFVILRNEETPLHLFQVFLTCDFIKSSSCIIDDMGIYVIDVTRNMKIDELGFQHWNYAQCNSILLKTMWVDFIRNILFRWVIWNHISRIHLGFINHGHA